MANTECESPEWRNHGVERWKRGTQESGGDGWTGRGLENDWWAIEPDVGRVADGVPARMDRLKGLGNAIVPQIAEWIARCLLARMPEMQNTVENFLEIILPLCWQGKWFSIDEMKQLTNLDQRTIYWCFHQIKHNCVIRRRKREPVRIVTEFFIKRRPVQTEFRFPDAPLGMNQ